MTNPVVGIVMGSQSDWPTLKHAQETLKTLGIASEAKVLSAHRQPVALEKWVTGLEARGFKVVIAGAGMAAALPGVVAARTRLPVLGVPMGMPAGICTIDKMLSSPSSLLSIGTPSTGRRVLAATTPGNA